MKEDVKGSTRGRWKPDEPSRSKEVLVDTLSLLPKKTSIEKPESVGILSNDKESITSVDTQDQTMLSVSQDVEDPQVQSQGRRLDVAALQAFKDKCVASVEAAFPGAGLSGSDAYVDCDGGFAVVDGVTTSETCAAACGNNAIGYGGDCCTGRDACSSFTGKGEQRVFHLLILTL